MRTVRSRVLLGVGAWLLGATSATAGSLYAVSQLSNSLLAVSTKQISVSMVNAALAQENARSTAPAPTAGHKSSDHRGKPWGKHGHSKSSAAPSQSPSPPPSSSDGVLLTSPDGSAEAVCTAKGAYLAYSIPQSGFEVDDVVQGPAAIASVTFRGSTGAIEMKVSCRGGVPVKRLVNVGWHGHDE
jgi:hypothetical protein